MNSFMSRNVWLRFDESGKNIWFFDDLIDLYGQVNSL